MATPEGLPSTPARETIKTTPASAPTGTWRHPQLDEIARRQRALTFSKKNLSSIIWNAGCFVGLWLAEQLLRSYFPTIFELAKPLWPATWYIYFLVRLVLGANIFIALYPLFRRKDDLSDIPLTPAQRKLLGLPPSGKKPSPNAMYMSPPRYPRSQGSPSSSPLSNRSTSGSPGTPRRSTYSNSPSASPLWQKAVGSGKNGAKGMSYGSPSPMGLNFSVSPATPSPPAARNASVGLNNKWLYERSRGSPSSSPLVS